MFNCRPPSFACGDMMADNCSTNSGKSIFIWFNVIFDRSILLISSTSLMRLNRCLLEIEIFCRQSATRSRLSIWAAASVVIPTIAFIGVLISWLMEDRNPLFARLASSARSSACSNACFACLSAVSMSVTSARTIQIVWWLSSPHSTLICLKRVLSSVW